ncbi:hypothetical protein [Iningainema tapete]|uniref:Uncharacterized protein n=1 Tax=Iningainema tapete BLCC-T55 TaxID=2748662 RepID=A0A8J6XFU8_9CYAN|nr:hypothetical protein [Iningainema tapete]MBD2770794.1 hypothetical protein [Iningainema tapete BLCC-T55]
MSVSIEIKQLDNIATWMISVIPTNLPSVLRGIFYMDGNPLPDDCFTFYNLEWDEKNLTLFLPVSAPLQWTFHKSLLGALLLRAAQISRFTYKIQFEDDALLSAQIIPIGFGIPVPSWIVYPTLWRDKSSQNGNTWQRKNVWFGGIPYIGEYTLRKIVDENGNYTDAFNDMLAEVKNDCLVIV